jgi:hypothetical protein
MSIYEAIGIAWVIFTSSLATIAIIYLAIVGLRSALPKQAERREQESSPMQVAEMFKIAR